MRKVVGGKKGGGSGGGEGKRGGGHLYGLSIASSNFLEPETAMHIEIAAVPSQGGHATGRWALGVRKWEGPRLNATVGRYPLSDPVCLHHRSHEHSLNRAL